jgi:hypothetical protein
MTFFKEGAPFGLMGLYITIKKVSYMIDLKQSFWNWKVNKHPF